MEKRKRRVTSIYFTEEFEKQVVEELEKHENRYLSRSKLLLIALDFYLANRPKN
ncbi:MAG: hypothetical protein ACRC6A_08465 [Fusobacteriaceae bacterium]